MTVAALVLLALTAASAVAAVVLRGDEDSAVCAGPRTLPPAEAVRAEPEPGRISHAELRGYPPLLFLWAERPHMASTAAGDVYTARADGTGVRVVRAWPDELEDGRVYGAFDARWSPDGEEIGLLLGRWYGDPTAELARVSADGTRLQALPVRGDIRGASFSPVWTALLTTYRGDELWVASLAGGKPVRILRGDLRSEEAAWSPDGRRLVVRTEQGLLNLTSAGAGRVLLTRWGDDMAPAWSPDGRTIAFVRAPTCLYESNCAERRVTGLVGADGCGVRLVTAPVDTTSLRWSPDGRSLLLTSERVVDETVLSELHLLGADGRRLRRLTFGHFDVPVGWAPDGSRILFVRGATAGDELWAMDADGGRQTRLPLRRHGWSIGSVDWAPAAHR